MRYTVRGVILALLMMLIPAQVLAENTDRHSILYRSEFFAEDTDCDNSGSKSTTLTGHDNAGKAFAYFVQKGLTPAQSAGIVGNLMQESGVNPSSANTAAGVGGSIAQWEGARWTAFLAFAAKAGKSKTDLGVQLDYLWHELHSGEAGALAAVKKTSSAADAAVAFEENFERASIPMMANRIKFAKQVLSKYGGSVPSSSASTVSTSDCGSSGSGVVSGDIIKTAIGLAWPTPKNSHEPTPAYKTAMVNPGGDDAFTDCGTFVATVMIKSGTDVHYPKVTVTTQKAYAKNHPKLYQVIDHPTKTSQLQPGDILASDGHTMIYLGDQGGKYPRVDASWHDHTPQMGNGGGVTWMFGESGLIAIRALKSSK